ncbi:toxin [Arcanobacterium canis]
MRKIPAVNIWDMLDAISTNAVDYYPTAFKHGCTQEDIRHALDTRVARWVEADDPLKVLIIGLDTHSRPLEIAVIANDTPLVIHAMPARKKYLSRLEQGHI